MAGKKGGNSRHVVSSGTEFKVKSNGRTTSTHRTQAAGIKAGRTQLGKTGGGELNIHNMKGQIRAKDTIKPGNDPRSSKGETVMQGDHTTVEALFRVETVDEVAWLMKEAGSLGLRCTVTSPVASNDRWYRVQVHHASRFGDVVLALETLRNDIAKHQVAAA